MLLAATDQGLGSVWIGIWPIPSRMAQVRKILDIPETVRPFSMVFIGYPAEEREGRSRYNEKAIHWQKYDSTRKLRTKDKPKLGHY